MIQGHSMDLFPQNVKMASESFIHALLLFLGLLLKISRWLPLVMKNWEWIWIHLAPLIKSCSIKSLNVLPDKGPLYNWDKPHVLQKDRKQWNILIRTGTVWNTVTSSFSKFLVLSAHKTTPRFPFRPGVSFQKVSKVEDSVTVYICHTCNTYVDERLQSVKL